jgi:hypothetical protein
MARVTMTHINGEVEKLDWYENDSLMASLNTEETFDCFVDALEHLQHEAKRFKDGINIFKNDDTTLFQANADGSLKVRYDVFID